MRRTLGFLAGLAVLSLASPSAPAAEGKARTVTFKSGDEAITGFLAEPAGKGPFPAIVVVHEWWGLSDWIKDNAKRLAAQGYVVLAPDLYRGKVTTDPKEARESLTGLPHDRALRDVKAAVDYLAGRDNVHRPHIGCVGWCSPPGIMRMALADPRIRACVTCYCPVVTDPDELKPLKAAVLGIFGEEDRGIPPSAVRQFEKALKEAGKQGYRIEVFKAGHGFMRPGTGSHPNPAYREKEAEKAWQCIDEFFATTLKGK